MLVIIVFHFHCLLLILFVNENVSVWEKLEPKLGPNGCGGIGNVLRFFLSRAIRGLNTTHNQNPKQP